MFCARCSVKYAWVILCIMCADNARRFLYALLAVTVGAFVGALALIGISFYWFNPSGAGDCSFNVFVLVFTIAITVAVSLLSMHPQASCQGSCASPREYKAQS